MNHALTMIGIASAVAIGAMSPGPSFVVVARTAVASSRTDGIYAALGRGLGGMLFAVAALLGLHALMAAVPWLALLLKIAGGIFLTCLGFRIYRGAKQPFAVPACTDSAPPVNAAQSFLLGLGTQISNPKTAIVYASVFAALLPDDIPLSLTLLLPFLIFSIEAGWYAAVALALSSAAMRTVYFRFKASIDRGTGGVMMLLGVKLAASARQL